MTKTKNPRGSATRVHAVNTVPTDRHTPPILFCFYQKIRYKIKFYLPGKKIMK